MSNYNLNTLTDRDFERLANDIISEIENTHVEVFTAGRDGGIDGRFEYDNNNIAIIQAKHYWKSGVKKLLQHCIKTEADKVKKLRPNRYIFVCSSGLTPKNKDTIKDTFSPFILRTGDIYGEDEISSFLDQPNNQKILIKNHKLWLTSANVLLLLQNAGLYNSSAFKLEDIKEKARLYVTTNNHYTAAQRLEKNHCLVITGEPGVGKTTLAEQMCNLLVSQEYRFYEIHDIHEAFEVIANKEKQVFFFDDFLGSNYLDAIDGNSDSKVMQLINIIKRSDDKRFILTSRSSILTQGKNKSVTFQSKNIESEEYTLKIDNLTTVNKAEILYNHIYFSDLAENIYINFFRNKNYRKIINHKNFNPRIIEFITDNKKLKNFNDVTYWNHVMNSLENPSDVWKQAIERQLKPHQRLVLYILCMVDQITEDDLEHLYDNNFSEYKVNSESETPFREAIEVLTGSYIKRSLTKSSVSYSLLNPSLADYLIPKLLSETKVACDLILPLWPIHAPLWKLKRMFGDGYNFKVFREKISKRLLDIIFEANSELQFKDLTYFLIMYVKNQDSNTKTRSKVTSTFIKEINSFGVRSMYYLPIILNILDSKDLALIRAIDWDEMLYNTLIHSADHDDLIDISHVIKKSQKYIENLDEVMHEFSSSVVGYWEDELQNRIDEELTTSILSEYKYDRDDIIDEIGSISDSVCDDILDEYYVTPEVSYFDLSSFIDTEGLYEGLLRLNEGRIINSSLIATPSIQEHESVIDDIFSKELKNR